MQRRGSPTRATAPLLTASIAGALLTGAMFAAAAPARATEAGAALPALVPWTAAAPPPLSLPGLAASGSATLLAPDPVSLGGLGDRIVVVHFFATWCEPCREELASLSRLAGERPNDLAIVAVDVGEVPIRVRRFLDEAPVDFPVLIDADRQAAAAWGVRALPTSFVFGAGLAPRLEVVGDLDWTAPRVRAALDAVAQTTAVEAGRDAEHRQRNEEGEDAP